MGDIIKPAHGPEYHIQEALVEFLESRGWLVERMIGNAYQQGIPDLYCFHPSWGERWIDVKVEGRYSFTKAQKTKWPLWESFGCPIWILTDATQEQYDKLFDKPNWRDYWKPSWDKKPNIDALMDEIPDDDMEIDYGQ
jgi:hypothetical protein